LGTAGVPSRAVSRAWLDIYDVQPLGAWAAHAACKGETSLFFARDDVSQRGALAICRCCPVRRECVADAVANEPRYEQTGVLGGLTPRERGGWRRW
jgi:WhiB family redox-sensing transcriptional regulator